MKVRVVKNFIDKETRKFHKADKKTIIEVSKARYEELTEAGNYVVPVEDTEDEEQEVKALDDMTVAELKEYASRNNIELNGARRRDEILSAIRPS